MSAAASECVMVVEKGNRESGSYHRHTAVWPLIVILLSLAAFVLQGGAAPPPVPTSHPGVPLAYASLGQAKKAPFREQVNSSVGTARERVPSDNGGDSPPAYFLPADPGVLYPPRQASPLAPRFISVAATAVRPLRDRPAGPRAPPKPLWF